MHDYLDDIGAPANYIGLVIAALSLGAMLSAPIYAKITDHFKRAAYILKIGMLFRHFGVLSQKLLIILMTHFHHFDLKN